MGTDLHGLLLEEILENPKATVNRHEIEGEVFGSAELGDGWGR